MLTSAQALAREQSTTPHADTPADVHTAALRRHKHEELTHADTPAGVRTSAQASARAHQPAHVASHAGVHTTAQSSTRARSTTPRQHPRRRTHIRPGVDTSTINHSHADPRRRAQIRPGVGTSRINLPTPPATPACTPPPRRRHEHDEPPHANTPAGVHTSTQASARGREPAQADDPRVAHPGGCRGRASPADRSARSRCSIGGLDRGARSGCSIGVLLPVGMHRDRAEMPGLAEYRTDPGGARNDAFTLATAPRAARPRSARRAIQALSGVGRVGPPEVRRRAGCASGAGVVSRVPASRRARPSGLRRRGGPPRWPPPRCSRRSRWTAGSR